jgi:hypothetical protein
MIVEEVRERASADVKARVPALIFAPGLGQRQTDLGQPAEERMFVPGGSHWRNDGILTGR